MLRRFLCVASVVLLAVSDTTVAQPPGITFEMINAQLPLDGAPLAKAGPYATIAEEVAHKSPRHFVIRPADLGAFPKRDTLPVLVWANGGCAMDDKRFHAILKTVASYGFMAVTTTSIPGEEKRAANADDLRTALDWVYAENVRDDSPLLNKIDLAHVAVMGVSCGGMLAISLGADPRVKAIGVLNSGVQPPRPGGAGNSPTTDDLAKLHGPVLFLNGGERDFMNAASKANFDLIKDLPTFYGARFNAGHTATYFHPGGGEFANVVSSWLRYQFKGDKKAATMFVGKKCELCKNRKWDVAAKNLQ